jgi:TPR repeat protein
MEGCPGFPANPGLAVHYLEASAKAGNSRAQANLGKAYSSGTGVVKNPYLAYDLVQRSAGQNDIQGIVLLATFYMEGVGVPANYEKAYALLNGAATMNVEESDKPAKQYAQYLVAECLAEGAGVPRNATLAYKWFLLAIGGPDKELSGTARKRISDLEGMVSDMDKQQATASASAINGGSAEATVSDMRDALNQALGGKKEEDATSLARLLATKEDSVGERILGMMYKDGYGSVGQDLDEAYVLFKRSCKAGEWLACGNQVEVLQKMGRASEARALLEEVSLKAPKSDSDQLYLGQLNLYVGNFDRAESIARSILINDPINADAKALLDKIAVAGGRPK